MERIFELRTEISRLLEERPQHRQLQLLLDERLKAAGSSHNRMILLKMMMAEKITELQSQWDKLNLLLGEINANIKKTN